MLANQRVELNAAIEKQKVHKHTNSAIVAWRTWSTRSLIWMWTSFCNNLSTPKRGDMRSIHALRSSLNCGAALSSLHLRLSGNRDSDSLAWHSWAVAVGQKPPNPSSVNVAAPPHKLVSPRSLFMQTMMATLQKVLDNGNPQAGSLIACLNQVMDTLDVQVQEPLVVVKKHGRPIGSKNKTSTTRDKSHFEYVEGRKCGVCGQSGHNLRTYSQK
jgi:hypothetical protein